MIAYVVDQIYTQKQFLEEKSEAEIAIAICRGKNL
jgi:hypothetical protein